MALLIDSTVFIAVERAGHPPAAILDRLRGGVGALSAITASELLHGLHRAQGAVRRVRREQFVEAILRSLPVLPVTLEVARFHSRLWAALQQRGEIIAPHDLLIAATALTHNLTVLTSNHRHFARIDGLKLSIW